MLVQTFEVGATRAHAQQANEREFNGLITQFYATNDVETRFKILRRQEQLINEWGA